MKNHDMLALHKKLKARHRGRRNPAIIHVDNYVLHKSGPREQCLTLEAWMFNTQSHKLIFISRAIIQIIVKFPLMELIQALEYFTMDDFSSFKASLSDN